jgi:chromosome partitioning protein
MGTPVLTLNNQKGGVGKTTTAVTLAAYYGAKGWPVLIVDCDPQGHVAESFGFQTGSGLYQLLIDSVPIDRVAVEVRPNVRAIFNAGSSENIGFLLSQQGFAGFALSNALQSSLDKYKLVILDTSPSKSVLHVAAMVAASHVLIPTDMKHLGLVGVSDVVQDMEKINQMPGMSPRRLAGALPTMFDRVTTETRTSLIELVETVGARLVLPPILRDTRIAEASGRGMTIFEYDPNSPGAIGYLNGGGPEKNSRGRVGGYLHLAEILETLLDLR